VSALATAPVELFGHPPGDPLTLEERLELELGAALSGRPAVCPACGGRMTRSGDAEARCGDCGTALS
jgi:tRNA(Ile2) C34 agmatinyltransferase TiaS